MKDTLGKLNRKKIIISAILIILLVFMVGLIAILKPSIKNIKISKVLTNTKTLSASVIDGVSEEITSNNYDEIKYEIEINKDNSDTAVVTATLSDKEYKYARFKKIKDSVITDNGKSITVTTTKNKINLTIIVENAPYGLIINPTIKINSEDENNSTIHVDPVTITGKSVEGTVKDENGTTIKGIELILSKNGEEQKRTYTKDNGEYVIALGDIDNYQITLAESKYKLVRYEDETTDDNRKVLNIVIEEVEPFNLTINKTIYKLDLVVNGKKEEFNYDDETKVVKAIKNAKTIEGSIYYNIYLKNEGEVKGTLTVLKDVIPEGMSFDESKNPGWTKEGNNLFYTPLEGTELGAFEKTSAKLVLDIIKTNEAKTYINSAIGAGDDYKYVVYYLNNNVYRELYVVNSDKIDNINPQVENFSGWYTDRNYTNKYDFNKEVDKDIILYGKIDNKKYNVTFIDKNPSNNQETILDIVEVPDGESTELVDHPEYNGYTFKCFTLYDSCYDDEPIIEDIELYTSYTVDNYEIEYNLDGGSLEQGKTNPEYYTVRDEITLNNPSKEGYTFLGWTGTGLSNITKTVVIPEGSTGKRTYTANYQINRSTLTIDPNGGTYEDNSSLVPFTEDYGTIKVVSESKKRGYTFKEYEHTGGGSYQDLSYTFDNEDGNLTAIYEVITYRITYDNITEEERAFLTNPTDYDVETETFTLKNPNTRVDGQGNNYQDFLGWDDGNGNVSLIVTIPKGSIGDKAYTAVWRENGDDYAITYNLNGGAYAEGKTNPSTYTRQTETFTLNNPGKNGYNFIGWTGTGLTGNTTTVTIPKGSAGDRAYTANYEVIPYEIHYHGLTQVEETSLGNVTGYNIESAPITLTNPTRVGYEFIGWSGTDIADKSTSVLIPTGSTGDRDYTANFRKIEYSLSYTLNDGEYEEGKSNPPKYTIESDDITLNNPSKNGYTFKGWSGTDLNGNENTTVVIPTGSIGHRSFLANYTPITYNITYDYDGGTLPSGVVNPDRYNIESDEITFNSPEKEGYTFLHYKQGNNIVTSIPTGSTGNVDLKAYYQINKFDVKYYNGTELFSTDIVDWNEVTTAPNTNPTKAHNIFLYWSEDGNNEFNFTTRIKEDRNLYAVYEEVVAPTITFSPLLDETTNRTWVCSNSNDDNCGVTVTITSDHSDYELYYKIGDGEEHLYTAPFKVYENTTITAFSKKSDICSAETKEDVENVDAIAPTINQPSTGSMSFNITVRGVAHDASSGVKKFTLYAKEKDALTWDDTLTFESEIFDGIKDHSENYDHTFIVKHDDTEYIVKIVAEDYVGNISEKEVEVKTNPYVARIVGKNGMLWYTVDPDTKEFVFSTPFVPFDSIQMAINYCAEMQCTIQTNPIYSVVNESVTVAQGQNITIDLDGRGITSDESATIINNGELHIVDRNPRLNDEQEHESIGHVKNTTEKAIVNNNKLVLGEGSSEASETFIYPELDRPIIEGKINAIEQNKEFHFYDGKLVAEDTVIEDHGDDAITQYSYNVVFTGEADKKIGTLDKVTDPEARIRSTYYAKLKNNTLNAFDSSKSGSVEKEEAKLLSKIKQASDYGFIYDVVNDEIYSGNSSTANTTALSYLKLDFTNETEDKCITFDTFADTYNSNSYGYVSVSETFGQTGTQIYRTTGNNATATRIYCLEKGKVYYVYFGFVKGAGDITPYELFKITNFKILGERQSSNDIILYNDPSYYGFSKQADGSYKNNNTSINNSYAHTYTAYDLRNETEDIDLIINVTSNILNGGSRAWIYTSDSINFQGPDDTTNRYFYINESATNRTFSITLKHGKVTYVHFGYYNYYEQGSSFYINEISLSKTKAEDTLMQDDFTPVGGFTKHEYYSWKDLSGNNRNGMIFGATRNEAQTGYVFDGDDYVAIGRFNNNEFTWYTKFNASTVGVVMANYESGGIGISVINDKIRAELYIDGAYRDLFSIDEIEYGRDYEVYLTFKEGTAIFYVDGVEQDRYEGETLKYPERDTIVMLGSNPDTTTAVDSFFNGTIYSAKVYNRELTVEEITGTVSNEGLILNLDGSNPYSEKKAFIRNTNIGGYYDTSHAYVEYDLTNVDEDKYLYINVSMFRLNGNGYVQVTDSVSSYGGASGRVIYLASTVEDTYGIVKLKKNTINYVHFYYTNNWNSNPRYKDVFLIKEFRIINSLDDAYSMNPSNYEQINNYYFEKPILNEKVDTIELLKNINLTSAINVPQEKEVIIDLNGFTLTTEADDYIFKNNGNLTITDTEYIERRKQNVEYKIEQSRLFEEAKTQYFADKAEYEEYMGLCDGCEPSAEYKLEHRITDIKYTGSAQTYTAAETGTYKLQVWGAQGGYRSNSANGGKGGYSEGLVELQQGDIVYVYVGGSGNTGGTAGGFNGGGSKTTYAGGGGATDMRVEGDTLYNRIIVAGGGGSDGSSSNPGKAGGGLTGVTATETNYCSGGEGGTQTSAGTRGSFGQGGSGGYMNAGWGGGGFGGAGGGGWYGGGGVNPDRSDDDRGGGGGSGFVYDGTNEVPEGYAVTSHVLTEATTIVGTSSEIPTYDGTSTMTGNSGNGYAKITYVLSDEEIERRRSELEKTYNVKEEPKFVDYLGGIDFVDSIDINTLTPSDSVDYNNTVSDNPNGGITTTISHAILNEQYATLVIENAGINVNVNSKTGIHNRGNLIVKDGAVINANNSSTIGIFNESNGKVDFTGGVINAKGSSTIGLLNRSNASSITGIKVVTTPTDAIGIRNEAVGDVAYNNLDLSGAGIGFREFSSKNTSVSNSAIKSTGNCSINSVTSALDNRFNVISSSMSGTVCLNYSPRRVVIDNSTLTAISNTYGNITVNNSVFNYIDNRGDALINGSTLTGTGTIIYNYSLTKHGGSYGTDYNSNLIIKDSIINSTATSATTVIDNSNDMIIGNTTINNTKKVSSTAISNTNGSNKGGYLTVYGNTSIDPSFGTAISNTGVVTIGNDEKNVAEVYEYAYTGHQEEFVAPADGLYKLETWGASGAPYYMPIDFGFIYSGSYGAYASGTVYLHEGDKLYVHVGEVGAVADRSYESNFAGSYNGGGRNQGGRSTWDGISSGGGATDISLSDEDNTWYYDNGVVTSRRSNVSYEQRLVVAGGGGSIYNDGYGGYSVDSSTSRLGYGDQGSGGGYYGGTSRHGGSSYVDANLTNAVMKTGNEEMPDYTSSGLVKGNFGNGYAKITLLNSDSANVTSTPTIYAINYGITGSGRVIYHDGTFKANVAVNSDIELVPDNYDIYKSIEDSKEKIVLIPNANSRPVESGEEEFVAAIGNAKYATIQNAIDAANNGDEIDLLVNIEEQNVIVVSEAKQVTLDYNGHTVKTYNDKYLYKNFGDLTITDSTNTLGNNKFMGDKYIYNEGTLNVSNIYISNYNYSTGIIENNEGTVVIDGIKIDFGSSISSKNAITNTENGTITVSNSTLNLSANNNLFSNNGNLTLTDNTITSSNGNSVVRNNDTGTAILDGNSYSVSGNDEFGRYLLVNTNTATVRNMTTHIEDISNSGVLTLETNNIPSGAISSSGLVIINSGTYSNSISISGAGKSIDNTENLYSLIMHDGILNKTLSRSATGITNIEGGTISVTSDYAINNSSTGIINLGINDGLVEPKASTTPIITGKTYGIYTSNPSLIVNFYDGIINGKKSYNVTVQDIETGYSINREYDETNDIETKYLTNEPMFTNDTQGINYNSVSDFNNAISNGLVNNNDVIKAYRNITITLNDDTITIPVGLNITFDLNGKTIDKNNNTMFIINGEMTATDSDTNNNGFIDSTKGNIFVNNGTLIIDSGKFTSEKELVETEIINNSENANLTISGGTFTKYYDLLDYPIKNSGAILVNSGTANVTSGNFIVNGSFAWLYWRHQNNSIDYFHTSTVYVNNATGILNVSGGTYDGITGTSRHDYYNTWSGSTPCKGEFIYNYGVATIENITSNISHIGLNSGTISFDNVIMEKIININARENALGSHPNFINTGDLTITGSTFKTETAFLNNRGGNVTITNTTIDKTSNGNAYNGSGDTEWDGYKNSHVIRNYNANNDCVINISNSYIYNRGSGEVIDNSGNINITRSTLEASNHNVINSWAGKVNVDNSDITAKNMGVNLNSTTSIIKGNSSIISTNGNAIGLSSSTLNLGEPISDDAAVSQTYPLVQGNSYGVSNSNSTFNFYDGIIKGKTNHVNGVITTIEPGYMNVDDIDGDYKVTYLDRVPIVQNITQATPSDEKKYYDLKLAFEEAVNGDTLQMISNYSNLPDTLTAVNNVNVTLDLNGKYIRQCNDFLLTNNGILNLIDSSQDKTGNIIGISGNKVIDNYGTINFTGGKISSSTLTLIIRNNTGSTLNIRDDAKIVDSIESTLINNDGTVNIYNGAYLYNKGGAITYWQQNNSGLPMIINNNIVNIIDLNNDDDENTSSELLAPWLFSNGNQQGLMAVGYPNTFNDPIVLTNSGATTNIYGGIYNNNNTSTTDGCQIVKNQGTTTIKNLDTYSYGIGKNEGTMIIDNSYFHNFRMTALVNSGNLTIKDTTINFYSDISMGVLNGNDTRLYSNGTLLLDNVDFIGGNITSYHDDFLFLAGNSEIRDSRISLTANTTVITNTSSLVINNSTISMNKPLTNTGTLTVNNSDITSSDIGISNSGTVNLDNNSTVISTGGNGISNSGRVNMTSGVSISATNGNGIYNTGNISVPVGVTVTSQNGNGIYLDGSGTLILGEFGGVPDQTSPRIEGSTYGVYNNSRTSRFEFYDGLLIGEVGHNPIYGALKYTESGYQTNVDTDTVENKNYEYLVVSANTVAVATVGTYTFVSNGITSPSVALQQAIDHAIKAEAVVNLVLDVDLTNDEFSLTASEPVTVNLNGHNVHYNDIYTVGSNISLNDNGTGGNVSRLLASIISPVTRDVIIYEMSDGNSLDVNKTYKLYKNGELIKLSKEEFGKYSYKGDNEDLVPIKGRLYINDLTSGSYRLLSSDNRYIEFSIDDEGHVSGNVSEYISKNYGSTSKASAELILTIQTGIKKHYYLLAIIPISLLIIALIVIIRKRKVS